MSQTRSGYRKCLVEFDEATSTLTIIPLNDQGDTELKDFFTAETGNTTVAITQSDAGRGGYGETSGPYSKIALAIS